MYVIFNLHRPRLIMINIFSSQLIQASPMPSRLVTIIYQQVLIAATKTDKMSTAPWLGMLRRRVVLGMVRRGVVLVVGVALNHMMAPHRRRHQSGDESGRRVRGRFDGRWSGPWSGTRPGTRPGSWPGAWCPCRGPGRAVRLEQIVNRQSTTRA